MQFCSSINCKYHGIFIWTSICRKISEGWKVAGMFVGTYTGGSANLTAIGTGLNVSRQTLAAANAADYVIGVPTLIFMFALPAILKTQRSLKALAISCRRIRIRGLSK